MGGGRGEPLKRPDMRDRNTPVRPPTPIFAKIAPEVRFGPKPTATPLFWPKVRKNALKMAFQVQILARFFKPVFWQETPKIGFWKCFEVPKDAKLRARRPRVGIFELSPGTSTIWANMSHRRPNSKSFLYFKIGEKFWHMVDECNFFFILRGFCCSRTSLSRDNCIWSLSSIFAFYPISHIILNDRANLRPDLL